MTPKQNITEGNVGCFDIEHRINQIQLIFKKCNIHHHKKQYWKHTSLQDIKNTEPDSTTWVLAINLKYTYFHPWVKPKSKKSLPDIKHTQVHQVWEKTLHASCNQLWLNCTHLFNKSKQSPHTHIFRRLRFVAQRSGSRGSHCSVGAGQLLAAVQKVGCEQKPSSGCSSESRWLLRCDRLWRTPAGSPPAQLFCAWWNSNGSWWHYQFYNRNTYIWGVLKTSVSSSDRLMGRKLLLAFLFKPQAVLWPFSCSHLYKCYCQLLRKDAQYKR